MLYKHFTQEILGLQDVIITKVENNQNEMIIYAELERKPHKCNKCGAETNSIHDYRQQVIKDIPAFGKLVSIVLRKRRYRCPHCGKRFFENNSFVPKYHRMTNRLAAYVINRLTDERSFTSVAKETNLSVSTVIRVFDKVSYPKAKLSSALAIDEFKGNTWGEKYQCILTDPINKTVLDILPKRYESYLSSYFKTFPKSERDQVSFFVSDMWKTYSKAADTWFPKATQIVDKYHWIRQVIWAFERIRKDEQKKLSPELRKYFKRSRSLLIKKYDCLKEEEKQQVNVMLYYSVNISRAHWYKESFLKALTTPNPDQAKSALLKWIHNAESCGLLPFEKCATTFQNWYSGIINSLYSSITNGFTEGCNNKIKVLKRNAYGYKNFHRFRNRILHIFSHQIFHKNQAAA